MNPKNLSTFSENEFNKQKNAEKTVISTKENRFQLFVSPYYEC